jgi:hypothetical protein
MKRSGIEGIGNHQSSISFHCIEATLFEGDQKIRQNHHPVGRALLFVPTRIYSYRLNTVGKKALPTLHLNVALRSMPPNAFKFRDGFPPVCRAEHRSFWTD